MIQLFYTQNMFTKIFYLLLVPGIAFGGACETILKPKVAAVVCPYLTELQASPLELDQRKAKEIEKSIEWTQANSSLPIPAFSLLPRLFFDFLGFQWLGKRETSGHHESPRKFFL